MAKVGKLLWTCGIAGGLIGMSSIYSVYRDIRNNNSFDNHPAYSVYQSLNSSKERLFKLREDIERVNRNYQSLGRGHYGEKVVNSEALEKIASLQNDNKKAIDSLLKENPDFAVLLDKMNPSNELKGIASIFGMFAIFPSLVLLGEILRKRDELKPEIA